ncbi:MAG TPA: ABC transporter permease, partial [Candidatus Synoicihabitans sp.]|nr:ABC transporter permease [Candidatus Synoicihabitans sp.]
MPAFRSLAKSPGFTVVALTTLALGIGVNTSMFSVLNTVIFHTAPYPAPDTLMRIFRTGPASQTGPHSPANIVDLRAQIRSFAHLAAFARTDYSLAEPGQPAERLRGMDVSGDFFATLGVQPALGRAITDADDQPGSPPVVVLSDATWRQRFAADPAILQRQIRLSGQLVTVIGVMPPGFDDPFLWGNVAAWRPFAFTIEQRQNRSSNRLHLFGRLRPGVSAEQAGAELSALASSLARAYPDANAQTGLALVPLARSLQDNTGRLLLWLTMGLAACVLLIACVNLANLLFARNALRVRELAIRTALGASRLRLVRLVLSESVLLAVLGGALGLLLAVWCNDLLGQRLSFAGQTSLTLPLDWRVIGFAFGIALLCVLAFGLLPALLASRTDVNEALKQGSRGSTSATNHRVRHALIVAEVALALVLLSGAGFFLRGLERMLDRDYGWRPENLLTATLTLPASKYAPGTATAAFFERLQSKLAAIPGVEHAAISRTLPYSSFAIGQRFVVEGRPAPVPGTEPQRDLNDVSPEYFDTIGLALVEGRNFTVDDLTGPVRTIVSESMAKKLWPGESAIGKRIKHPHDTEWQEIIGIVRNVVFATNLEKSTTVFQAYRLFNREPSLNATLTLRSALPPGTLAHAVRRAVAEVDPEQPIDLRPAVQVIEGRLANVTLVSRILAGFAVLGLLLAALGLYGVISGFVVQRTNEIGIRMALGAQVRDILRLVLGRGLGLALFGAVL